MTFVKGLKEGKWKNLQDVSTKSRISQESDVRLLRRLRAYVEF